MELLINNAPVQWLQENTISENPETGTSGVRELVLVMQKFWFSNSASERYTLSKPKLLTTLYYNFDVYSSTGYGYFPQTTFSGSLTTLYKRGDAYNELANALLVSLQETLVAKSFKAKETDMNWLSPIAFIEYYDERKKKTSQLADVPRGMYATYNDFLAKKPITDSVEILVIYNEYETETYACQFTAYRNEQPLSCYRNWGYFDGSYLFLNTGNGFYIKLTKNKEDYVFANLKEINKQHIKSYLTSSIQIGNSAYEVIKDYARAFNLTYKLDYDTGKLY